MPDSAVLPAAEAGKGAKVGHYGMAADEDHAWPGQTLLVQEAALKHHLDTHSAEHVQWRLDGLPRARVVFLGHLAPSYFLSVCTTPIYAASILLYSTCAASAPCTMPRRVCCVPKRRTLCELNRSLCQGPCSQSTFQHRMDRPPLLSQPACSVQKFPIGKFYASKYEQAPPPLPCTATLREAALTIRGLKTSVGKVLRARLVAAAWQGPAASNLQQPRPGAATLRRVL